MERLDIDTALAWRGRTVVDRDGEKVGTLREVYLDESDRPAWASVHTALFGLRESLVPLGQARALEDDRIQLPYTAAHVKEAPSFDPDVQLTPDEEDELHRHYELGDEAPAGAPPETGEPPSGDAMTRSEEEVRVRTESRPRERVRIKKVLVTDYVTKKVPVRREEVALERDPPGDADDS